MKELLRHLFLPHNSNNQRAKILHHNSLLLFAALFLILTLILPSLKTNFPGVLGTSSNVSVEQLLTLTNQERQKNNISPLVLNSKLTIAAKNKAQNMLKEDYWAHVSPTGETPWDFIKQSGYSYVYAGENLARGFTNTQDAVNAWMASPSHRANVLSDNYQDVGFAIVEGNLTGEKNDVLIVEEFGGTSLTPVEQKNVVKIQPISNNGVLGKEETVKRTSLIDPYINIKQISILLLSIFIIVLMLDIVVINRKKIIRFVSHSVDHLLFLLFILLLVLLLQKGIIF